VKHIDHYPGGEPVPSRKFDVDVAIGTLSIALLAAVFLTLWSI
jgi:hypothetical protein